MAFMNTHEELDDLIKRAKNGDQDAVEKILLQYRSIVNRIARAYYLMGGEVSDLIQEGMIGLLKAIYSYNEEKNASFPTFASLCIERRIQTAVRDAQRNKHQPLNESLSLDKENDDGFALGESIPAHESSDPLAHLLGQEFESSMQKKIAEDLSDFERVVLYDFIDGKSYAEIGEKHGKSAKSIDNAIQRIRKKLKDTD